MSVSNPEQAQFWNDRPGRNWVRFQTDLDAISEQATRHLLRAAAPRPGEAVLDIGCGAGTSTFALAEAVAPGGHVLGIDFSAPLTERAEERRLGLDVGNATFTVADAQDHAFDPGRYHLAASRFGVMFFSDPTAAFRNLARALRPGGRLAFVAWDGPEQNPWFLVPQQIAVARLGPVSPTPPDAPGPMAFRDIVHVTGLLKAAGLRDPHGESVAIELHHPEGLTGVLRLVPHVGPLARMMREKEGSEADSAAILAEVAAAFELYRSADGIRIPARINVFKAGAP
jgi:SAM-dependent methyltransferase